MTIARLSGGRAHLQDGPIDLILWAQGFESAVSAAYDRAAARFDGLLASLVAELPALRAPAGREVQGSVARRMAEAVAPHAARGRFVTPMAAVAGAVADEILAAMVAGAAPPRAYVNNGGDVALHLAPGESLRLGAQAGAALKIAYASPIRGLATSGRGGRSFSLGIADAVTAYARNAAEADVAATLIANAVDIVSPAIERTPARDLDPDSDLGERAVVVHVGALSSEERAAALDRGAREAEAMAAASLIEGALIRLGPDIREVGAPQTRP